MLLYKKPKEEITALLEDNETLIVNEDTDHPLVHASRDNYKYIPPLVDDIEEEVEGTFTISNYFFRSEEKEFKIDGISKNANSLAMPAQKRMQIITKAEQLQPVELKLKIIRDGLDKKIKQLFILDYTGH